VPDPVPLILLHPFPLDARFWAPAMPALSADRPVTAPEFPGLGGAEPEDEPTVDGFADAVAEIIGGLPGRRAAVCGLSLGGYVALALAARHPRRVAGLVLADTRAEPDAPEAREGRHASAALVRSEGSGPFLDEFVPRLVAAGDAESTAAVRAIADGQEPEAIARALEALAGRADRRPDLAQMDVPALVIVGDKDTLTPLASSEAMAAALPDAELTVIEGAGHFSALERPREFTDAVRAFLARRVDGAG